MFPGILERFRHRGREVDARSWRTRDGQQIDFLVEHRGRVQPIEVKLDMPSPAALPPLASIAAPDWRPGQVVTLATAEPQQVLEHWRAVAPWNLES